MNKKEFEKNEFKIVILRDQALGLVLYEDKEKTIWVKS